MRKPIQTAVSDTCVKESKGHIGEFSRKKKSLFFIIESVGGRAGNYQSSPKTGYP